MKIKTVRFPIGDELNNVTGEVRIIVPTTLREYLDLLGETEVLARLEQSYTDSEVALKREVWGDDSFRVD